MFDTGAQWTVDAANPAALNNAPVTGFVRGDTIDLQNVLPSAVSVSYASNSATISTTGSSFTIAGTFPDINAQSDGAGGTLLVVAPVVTADTVSPATGDYTVGKVLTFKLTTDEPVTVSGTPTLALNDGGSASYVSGSGTNQLTFTSTVAAGRTPRRFR